MSTLLAIVEALGRALEVTSFMGGRSQGRCVQIGDELQLTIPQAADLGSALVAFANLSQPYAEVPLWLRPLKCRAGKLELQESQGAVGVSGRCIQVGAYMTMKASEAMTLGRMLNAFADPGFLAADEEETIDDADLKGVRAFAALSVVADGITSTWPSASMASEAKARAGMKRLKTDLANKRRRAADPHGEALVDRAERLVERLAKMRSAAEELRSPARDQTLPSCKSKRCRDSACPLHGASLSEDAANTRRITFPAPPQGGNAAERASLAKIRALMAERAGVEPPRYKCHRWKVDAGEPVLEIKFDTPRVVAAIVLDWEGREHEHKELSANPGTPVVGAMHPQVIALYNGQDSWLYCAVDARCMTWPRYREKNVAIEALVSAGRVLDYKQALKRAGFEYPVDWNGLSSGLSFLLKCTNPGWFEVHLLTIAQVDVSPTVPNRGGTR